MNNLAKLTDAELDDLLYEKMDIGFSRVAYRNQLAMFDIEGDITKAINEDIEVMKREVLLIKNEIERRKIP